LDLRRTAKYTDLMVASMNGYAEIVKLLLEKGGNPSLKDNEGKTALDYAGNPDIKNLLKRSVTPDEL
jgi:ankyrin repeat protein